MACLVIDFASFIWDTAWVARRIRRFLPCADRLDVRFTPLLGLHVYQGNSWKAQGTPAAFGAAHPPDSMGFDHATWRCRASSLSDLDAADQGSASSLMERLFELSGRGVGVEGTHDLPIILGGNVSAEQLGALGSAQPRVVPPPSGCARLDSAGLVWINYHGRQFCVGWGRACRAVCEAGYWFDDGRPVASDGFVPHPGRFRRCRWNQNGRSAPKCFIGEPVDCDAAPLGSQYRRPPYVTLQQSRLHK